MDAGSIFSSGVCVGHDAQEDSHTAVNDNLIARWLAHNRPRGHDVAYQCGSDSISFQDLESQSSKAAAYFADLGIEPNQVVVINCEDSILWPVAWFGLILLGAIPLAVPPSDDPDALDTLLMESGAVAVILDSLDQRLAHPQIVLNSHMVDHQKLLAHDRIYQHGKDDTMFLLLSSGTTGRPKIVAHRKGQLWRSFAQTCNPYQLDHNSRIYSSVKLSTSWGMIMALLGNLACGYRVILSQGATDFHNVAELLDHHAVTHAMLFPRALSFMTQHCDSLPAGLDTVYISGEYCDPRVIAGFQHKFQIPVLNSYGCGEVRCWAVLTEYHHSRKLGSVGTAGPDVELRLVDAQDQTVQPGAIGRLCIRHDGVFKQYLNDPDATISHIKDGWYRTQDYMKMDQEGFYFYIGKALDAQAAGLLEIECRIRDNLATDDVVVLSDGDKKIAFVATGSHLPKECAIVPELVDQICFVSKIPVTRGSGKKSRNLEELQKHVVAF